MRLLTAGTVLLGLLVAAMAAYTLFLLLPLHPVQCYGEWNAEAYLCLGNGQGMVVAGAQ